VVVGAMALLAVVLLSKVVEAPAYDADNLFSLSQGPLVDSRGGLPSLLTEPFGHLPAYRPVPIFSLWLQYKLAGLAPESYFVVNIVLVVAMCVALYAVVYRITGSWAAACGAAFALLVDARGRTLTGTIVERDTALACVLGLLALVAVLAHPVRARPRLVAAAIFFLLLLAALSKEYGLAFSAAVFVAALLNRSVRSRPVVIAALGAVLAYAALRWVVAGGTTGGYCEDMGYFDQLRSVCFGHKAGGRAVLLTGGAQLAQHAYNIAAAFVGTFLPFLFTVNGSLTTSVSVPLAVWSIIVGGLATVAWVRIPRAALPFLALIVANSFLSVALYRDRNLVVAVVGLYGAAALGAVQAGQWLRSRDIRLGRIGIAAAAAGLVLWIAFQGSDRVNTIENRYAERVNDLAQMNQGNPEVVAHKDPCRYLLRKFADEHAGAAPILPAVVRYMKLKYRIADPSCRRTSGLSP
jgi:hypothetical protein